MNGVAGSQPDQVTDAVRVALEAWFTILSTEEAALLMTQPLQNRSAQPDLRVIADHEPVNRQ